MSVPSVALLPVLAAAAIAASAAGAVRTQGLLAALPVTVDAPPDNPTTPEKIALGRLLFWDPILSGPKDVACATCHRPQFAYTDGKEVAESFGAAERRSVEAMERRSRGAMPLQRSDAPPLGSFGASERRSFGATPAANSAAPSLQRSAAPPLRSSNAPPLRNTPTVINTAFNGIGVLGSYLPSRAPMFWDGRVVGLEAQVFEAIAARDEMRGDTYPHDRAVAAVVERIAAIDDYRARFARAFAAPSPVSAANLARAIAAFERSLVSSNSRFDRYMRGETTAMSAAEVRGMRVFEQFGCSLCHKGPMLSDYSAHVLGVPEHPQLDAPDTGFAQMYAFRTPSLRNVALTAPYMHNGVFASLEEVLAFYDGIRDGSAPRHPAVTDAMLDPLADRIVGGGGSDLLAFLHALTDPAFDRTVPDHVPSGLTPGGRPR